MAQTTVTEQQTITVETELGDIAKYLNATTLQLQQMTFIYNSIQGFPEAEVKALFNIIDQIVICSNNIASIVTTAGMETEITALAGIQAELEALFASLATITSVFDNLGAINGVNAISADVTGVNAISADVTTLAGISGAISALNAELAALVAINTNLSALLNLNTNTASLIEAAETITDSFDLTGAVAGDTLERKVSGKFEPDPIAKINALNQAVYLNQIDTQTSDYVKRVLTDSGEVVAIAETDTTVKGFRNDGVYGYASIVNSAGGVKAGKLYNLKGTDFTVARNSIAWGVNRDGILQEFAVNVPRTVFDSAGNLSGTLVEPQRTNLFLNHDPSDGSGGASSGVSYAVNDWGVLGFSNKTIFPETASTQLRRSGVTSPNTTYTLSVYIKFPNGESITPSDFGAGGGKYGYLTLAGDSINPGYVIENIAENLYRLSVTATTPSVLSDATRNGFQRTGANDDALMEVTGYQVEQGDTLTSIIRTGATVLTRLADVIQLTPTTGITKITEYFADDTTNEITTIPDPYVLTQDKIYRKIIAE